MWTTRLLSLLLLSLASKGCLGQCKSVETAICQNQPVANGQPLGSLDSRVLPLANILLFLFVSVGRNPWQRHPSRARHLQALCRLHGRRLLQQVARPRVPKDCLRLRCLPPDRGPRNNHRRDFGVSGLQLCLHSPPLILWAGGGSHHQLTDSRAPTNPIVFSSCQRRR